MITINKKIKSIGNYEEVPCGIQMTFENGNTISIQFGYGNYCNNIEESKESSETAEIAMWNKNKVWYGGYGNGDEVIGWCSADEVAKWISFCANNRW